MVTPLTRKLWRDLGRHRAQFIAVAVTIFLGVAIFAASYDSFRNLQTSYETTFTQYRFANLTVTGGDSPAIATELGVVDGVESVEVRTVADVPLQVGGMKMLGRIVGVPAGGQPAVNQLEVLEGSYLDGSIDAVLAEEHLTRHFGLEVGDKLQLLVGSTWTTVDVAGIVSSPEYIWPARDRQDLITSPDNFGVVFAPSSLASEVGGPPNEVAVYFDGGDDDPELATRLAEHARSWGAVSSYVRAEQPSNAALSEDIRGFEEMAVFFPLLFLSAAAMAAYVMISRLVHAQRPHIGVLLANGMTRRRVLLHYLGYGVVPGLLAAIPGAVAGAMLARLITRLYTSMLSVPITVIEFHPATLLGGVAFGLLAAGAAALAPAILASRVQPAEAMRGETPAGRGRSSLVERLVPPARRLPVRWKMALRGIERNPRRTVYTMLGVVLSLMLVLVSWGMIDTVNHLLDLQFVQIQRQDATVYFSAPVGETEVGLLENVDGVAAAEPALELPVTVVADGESYDTALVSLESGTVMHRFRTPEGEWIDLPPAGVLLGKALRSTMGLAVGDPVTLRVGPIGAELDTTVAGFVDEPLGTLAYLSRQAAQVDSGMTLPATSALIAFDPEADSRAVRNAITDLPQVAAFDDAKAMYDTVQDFMALFYGFVGVMLVFGSAMAFALIFNSMSVNIAERSREVATLLAVGTTRRTITRLVSTENLLVAIGAIPVGLVVGYFAARAAMATFESDLFAFDLYVAPITFVGAALAILLVAVLAQWPGLRAVGRIAIPKIIKERAA